MLTKLDNEIVSWIGGVGPADVEHVMARFGRSRGSAYKRLRSLVKDGFLEQRRVLFDAPALYVATAKGLRLRGLERLRTDRVGPGQFEHARQLATAAVALQAALPAWEFLGERHLRRRELDEGELLASVSLGGLRGADRALHRPDLALISPEGRVWAIEVELSVKKPPLLQAICRAWARARHVEGVCYLAAPQPQRAVVRAVKAVGAEDRVTVLGLEQARSFAEALRTGGLR